MVERDSDRKGGLLKKPKTEREKARDEEGMSVCKAAIGIFTLPSPIQ